MPLVVVAKISNALQLTAIDQLAARHGLYAGLPLADARARVPALDVVEADEAADRALLEAIADWCDRFTPLVALDLPDGLILDVTGCAHLFGGETALLQSLCGFVRRQEIAVQAAIAGTSVAARTLARGADGVIAQNGAEREAVTLLPVTALLEDDKIVYALKRAGLKTIGEVASRSSSELTARFGASFTFLLQQALGENGQPIVPRRPLPDYVAERRFAEPVATAEVILRTIASLASTLENLLEERGQGARRLEASFFRTDGAVRHIALDTGRPLRDAGQIAAYYAERLEVLADPVDPGFGFDLVRLSALATEPLEYKAPDLEASQDEAEIASLVDRLSARFGPERITRFVSLDTHVPEHAAAFCPAQRGRGPSLWPQMRQEGEAPRRPLQMLPSPEPLDKVWALAPDGPPSQFFWRRAFHKVTRAEGPERIAMEWWREIAAQTRDYFQIEDNEGRRFWIYRDGFYDREAENPDDRETDDSETDDREADDSKANHPRWFMHGLFA